MKFHFDRVEDIDGVITENAKYGDIVNVLTRTLLTSDDPRFYQYLESISNIFLKGIFIDGVYQFLIVIHESLSADLYINDFVVSIETRLKRADIKVGEVVTQNDIADIRKVKFPDIEIKDTDKIIYCFKVGWRFGFFFDLTPRPKPIGGTQPIGVKKLDIEEMALSIGELRRYLSFYHVYKVLESDAQFEEMKKDGWFPFIEILAREYKELSEAYQNKFDFENQIRVVVDTFTEERIKKITEKWWAKQIFADKKTLIEAGIGAFTQNTTNGFVNCIKNLWTEIEGILRILYLTETGKGQNVTSNELSEYIVEKAKDKTGSGYSLFLALPFLKYLQDVVFPSFNIERGTPDMSRHTSSHGVAGAQDYTKNRALQLILILDQIYFYS
ncbi:MAG: hypothetical protein MUO85_04405 [candidate division Zixibacteria bacterium]|nr:hypothetical protein [candidate division Zixibacteria bacterium]